MAHEGCFIELDDFNEPLGSFDKVILLEEHTDGSLNLLVDLLRNVSLLREDISYQRLEEGLILGDELGKIHISQGSRHNHLFISAGRLSSFLVACSSQY